MGNKKKETRSKFRKDVFECDNFTCQVCGEDYPKELLRDILPEEVLDAHHITDRSEMPNGGYVKENGVTVCKDECHMRVERFHISNGADWEEGLHPDDLYIKIGSSLEEAIPASEKL